MVTPIELYPGVQQALDSPEVLMINALVNSGAFTPIPYGVDKEMLASHDKVWQFCTDYQLRVGEPPPKELIARQFPDFEFFDPIDPGWAADQLRAKHHERTIRVSLHNALLHLQDGDLDSARELIAEAARPHLLAKPKGMSVYDPDSLMGEQLKTGYQVPYTALQEVTNGHGRGELFYIGGRQGAGKSWIAPYYAVAAAEQGAKVCVLTLEIPKKVYIRRTQLIIARHDLELQKALKSTDEKTRLAALTMVPHTLGSIEFLDPSDVKMTTKAVEMAGLEHDYVVVDHVGLLRDAKGKQAIEDWRIMAGISNRLKELTLELDIAILGLAQVNREGETSGNRAPKISNLSQSDALGQDGDIVCLLKRISTSVMKHDVPKNRGGFATQFYSKFLPQSADFTELSKDDALEMQRVDEDKAGDK